MTYRPLSIALIALFSAGAVMAAGPSMAHEYKVGEITVDHPYSFPTPATAKSGIGYVTIVNQGDSADRLVEVRSDFAKAALHRTEVSADGIARMINQDGGIDIPAGATVELKPGGLHVMFIDLKNPFNEGENKPSTLVFEQAGEILVDFKVKPRASSATKHDERDHEGMDHGEMEGEDMGDTEADSQHEH